MNLGGFILFRYHVVISNYSCGNSGSPKKIKLAPRVTTKVAATRQKLKNTLEFAFLFKIDFISNSPFDLDVRFLIEWYVR